jgi:hypothetical protein
MGAQFAQEVQILCTYLLDQSTPIATVRAHITKMRTLAKEAHQKAIATSGEFRDVRESFHQVSKWYEIFGGY